MKKFGLVLLAALLTFGLLATALADTTNQIAVISNGQTDVQTFTYVGMEYSSQGNVATDGEYEYVFQTYTKSGAVKSTLIVFVPCALVDNGGGIFKYGGDTMLGDTSPMPGNQFDYYTDTAALSLERSYGDVPSVFAAVMKTGTHLGTDLSDITLSPTYIFQMKVTPDANNPDQYILGLYVDTTEDCVVTNGTLDAGTTQTVDVILLGGLAIPMP